MHETSTTKTGNGHVQFEDLVPVGSRVSWGAILAGAVVALAVNLVFMLLGTGIGLSTGHMMENRQIATGAAVWVSVSTLISLFLGGWVASKLAVGENRLEAIIHGVIVWGVLFAMVLWFTVTGVSVGMSGMMRMAQAMPEARNNPTWAVNELQRRGMLTDDQVEKMKAQFNDADNREEIRHASAQAAWWSLASVVLSMVCAVLGALTGAGASFRLQKIYTHGAPATQVGG